MAAPVPEIMDGSMYPKNVAFILAYTDRIDLNAKRGMISYQSVLYLFK
jgi:hypothetical protein